MFIVTGLLSVAFGAIVVDRPGVGALTIALLFGLFSIAIGITAIVQGNELRRTGACCIRCCPGPPEAGWYISRQPRL
jgi:hypothetical protein